LRRLRRGSKLAAEGTQAKADARKARVEAMKLASEIADPRVRRLALLEALGDEFYDALLTDSNVVQLTVNGADVTDAA
jgi:hypothetical protein